MNGEDSQIYLTISHMNSSEARDRLHSIMASDLAETLEHISQTLEACNTSKMRMLNQLDEAARYIDIVRNECECIDTTISSKVVHLHKLVSQIILQMALVNIPDPPPPPPPPAEVDLSSVHDRLNSLHHTVTDLNKLIREKDETVLYVVNKRHGSGEIKATTHSPIRLEDLIGYSEDTRSNYKRRIETLLGNHQHKDGKHPTDKHRDKIYSRKSHHRLSPLGDEESIHASGERNTNRIDEHDDETSFSSDQTVTEPGTLYLPQTTEINTKQSSNHHSTITTNYTEQSSSLHTASVDGNSNKSRRLGEALASNGKEIVYYDYENKMIRVYNFDEYSIKFEHGLVVDLYWWSFNNEWLIASEQGLYRWKPEEKSYHEAYEFSNGEIGFRRIAAADTSIFCVYRYSSMLLELSNSMQMKRLHALAPLEPQYKKLADISVRKNIRNDGYEEEILGLIWFGSGPGILLEERHVTPQENNIHERSFRHVPVNEGHYARLASYDNGRAWLISNTGADVFLIVDNVNVTVNQKASATWVSVSHGTPINAVSYHDSIVCIRLKNGKLEFLESEY